LGEPTDAIHPIGKIKPMPVNGCGYSQPIRYIDSHPLAFDGLDRGAVHTAVESPRLDAQTRIEVMIDFLCDEMKNFNAIDDLERQSRAVWNDDRFGTSPRKNRGWRLNLHRTAAVAFLPIRSVTASLRVMTSDWFIICARPPMSCCLCLGLRQCNTCNSSSADS